MRQSVAALQLTLLLAMQFSLPSNAADPRVSVYLRDNAASIEFGKTLDVNLYRKDGQTLKTDDNLEVAGSVQLGTGAGGSSRLQFGNSEDTSLYRNGASTLRTDANLQIGSNLFVGAQSVDVLAALAKIYTGPSTITVGIGAGFMFNDLQSAWNSLLGKLLFAPVKIQLADGTYSISSTIRLENHATPHLIAISGNPADPERVVLASSTITDGAIVSISNMHGLTVTGIAVKSTLTPSPATLSCARMLDTADILLGTMSFSGCHVGLYVYGPSRVSSSGVLSFVGNPGYGLALLNAGAIANLAAPKFSDCGTCVFVSRGELLAQRATFSSCAAGLVVELGRAEISWSSMTGKGAGSTALTTSLGIINFYAATLSNWGVGASCRHGGTLNGLDSTISSVTTPFISSRGCIYACGPFGAAGAPVCPP